MNTKFPKEKEAMIPNSISRDRRSRLYTCAALSLLAISLCVGMRAQAPSAAKAQAKAAAAITAPAQHANGPDMTTADVSAFLDGIMPLQLAREDIAGAVVVVVKDGKVLFAKGYGYADVGKKTPVTPDGTLFRPGSVSKLFTWTAVMRLVEQGKLDLDRDINDYLDVKIPATYPKPITLRNLMTHTPRFEEEVKDLIVTSGSMMIPL